MKWAIEEAVGFGRRRIICKFETEDEAIDWLKSKDFKRWSKRDESEWEYCDDDIAVKAWLREVDDEQTDRNKSDLARVQRQVGRTN